MCTELSDTIKYNDISCSILGKKGNHINLTRIKTLAEVRKAILNLVKICSCISPKLNITNLKVDSISFMFQCLPSLKYALLQSNIVDISVVKPPKFCGVIIQHNKYHATLTYFSSQKCVSVGAKNVLECNALYLILTTQLQSMTKN